MSISPSLSLLCNCAPSQSRPSPREDPYDLSRLLTEIASSQVKQGNLARASSTIGGRCDADTRRTGHRQEAAAMRRSLWPATCLTQSFLKLTHRQSLGWMAWRSPRVAPGERCSQLTTARGLLCHPSKGGWLRSDVNRLGMLTPIGFQPRPWWCCCLIGPARSISIACLDRRRFALAEQLVATA